MASAAGSTYRRLSMSCIDEVKDYMAVHAYAQWALKWKVQTKRAGVTVMKSVVPGSEWDLVCGDTVIEVWSGTTNCALASPKYKISAIIYLHPPSSGENPVAKIKF